MTRVATIVPAEGDLLCEGCGYTLNGLPGSGNCPECGKPIIQSIGSDRVLPSWESKPSTSSFCKSTAEIIFTPTRFFRTLATRRDTYRAFHFAQRQWIISSFLFGLAAGMHATWYSNLYGTRFFKGFPTLLLWLLLIVVTYLTLWATSELAARLTHWEATYRGLRLPLPVVQRGLYYHSGHYLPVGLIALLTVLVCTELLKILPVTWAVYYLYLLCAEVLVGAAYLFKTYWIGMKNMMFANR